MKISYLLPTTSAKTQFEKRCTNTVYGYYIENITQPFSFSAIVDLNNNTICYSSKVSENFKFQTMFFALDTGRIFVIGTSTHTQETFIKKDGTTDTYATITSNIEFKSLSL